jgi:hypothetical protein
MPAGGLSFDKSHWVHIGNKDEFFVPYKVISRKFRGKFLDFFNQAVSKKEIRFIGKNKEFNSKKNYNKFKDSLYKKEWVVNIQAPFASPEKVLEYLSRYVFRIAITDRRITKISGNKVFFRIKDYRKGGIFREISLEINEFIRRFLLHILPKRFFKVRYYGIFNNRSRKENIALAKSHIENEKELKKEESLEDGASLSEKNENSIWKEILDKITTHKKPNCPACKKGRMQFSGMASGVP